VIVDSPSKETTMKIEEICCYMIGQTAKMAGCNLRSITHSSRVWKELHAVVESTWLSRGKIQSLVLDSRSRGSAG
jgi:hypothetical protein